MPLMKLINKQYSQQTYYIISWNLNSDELVNLQHGLQLIARLELS